MFCKQCGNEIKGEDKFCSVCGAKVAGEVMPAEQSEEGACEQEQAQPQVQAQAQGEKVHSHKKPYWIVGCIGVGIILAVLVIGLMSAQSKQLSLFEEALKQYESVLGQGALGIHDAAYETLLKDAQEAKLDKDKKAMKQLRTEMAEAEVAIDALRSQQEILKANRQADLQAIASLVMDEANRQAFDQDMTVLDQAIEALAIDQGLEVQKSLEGRINEVAEANNQTFQALLANLKAEDLTKAYPEEIETLTALTAQIDELIKAGNYKEAEGYVTQANQIIEAINVVMDNLDITMTQVDTTEYPRIKIYLDIKDRTTGEVPANLEKGFFYLSEKLSANGDYIKTEIQRVMQLDQKDKLNINIVADTSGSMNGYPLENAKYIMSNFLDYVQFPIGDQVELIAFSNGVYPLVDFTDQKDLIKNQIQYLTTGDMTSLYDALFTAVNRTAIQNGAKCIIAFTDGLDNYSECTAQEVIDLANRYRIPIFIIGIGDNIAEYELQQITDQTNGFYRNIRDVGDLAPIYEAIYRQQKELYVIEYDTVDAANTLGQRDIQVAIQTRVLGGAYETSYTPNLVVDASQSMNGRSAIDDLVGKYLRGFVASINSHNFAHVADYVVTNGPLYKEVKPYVEQKDITEKLLSYEVVEKTDQDDETCLIKVHETYEIQNQKEPLHLRILESTYVLKKQSTGEWRFYAFNDRIKILKKIRS